MKIICNQKLLANKIGISQKAINGKTTLELLKGILLSAKDGQLKLTGYDLEIGIETYTQAEVIEEGEIVVNARLFGDIIRKLPDSFVEIETDAENNVYINHLENAKIVPYIYNMEEVMNVSDLIVARSGAMTITEISNLGKASILIPLPNVSGDHQLHNAKVLENIGGARIILNNELNYENLNSNIEEIILNKNTIETMSKNALKVSTSNVEDKIFAEIKKIVRE